MDMDTLLSFNWGIMAPEFTILITSVLISLLDLFGPRGVKKYISTLALLSVGIAFLFLVFQHGHEPVSILYDTYLFTPFAFYFKFILLIGAMLIFLFVIASQKDEEIDDRSEHVYLLLSSLLGAMIMASSGDLITLFVGLELLSISSYIMVGLRKENKHSNEGAMKYVINGGIATAFTLFGMSYVYGITGSTNIVEISREMSSALGNVEAIAIIGFIIMFVGLSFKISTVPFHMWTPDVYQGAPTPVTAFLSVISKTAGFIIIMQIFLTIFTPESGENGSLYDTMLLFIAIVAFLTMVIGNLLALRQMNIKRLLAASSIGHAGYMLIPLTSLSDVSLENVWFYLFAYSFMTIGAFIVVYIMEQRKKSEEIDAYAGLYKTSPALAVSMGIFLLSLAGIPGTAGFIGKFNIFVGAVLADPALYVLAGVMAVTTIISYIYYFNILVQMFLRKPETTEKMKIGALEALPLVSCVAGTIILGIFPFLALNFF
jgi:NADH-quinone oxidoreductase subunit N